MKQLSEEQEGYLKALLDMELSYRECQAAFLKKYDRNLSLHTISSWVKRSKKLKEHKRRPKCTNLREDRIIIKTVKANRWSTNNELRGMLEQDYNINIGYDTLARRCKEKGIMAHLAKKKPKINETQAKKRLKFAREHQAWTNDDWNKVKSIHKISLFFSKAVFSDESKIEVNGPYRPSYVRRTKKSAIKSECVQGTVKFGGGNVKLWSCFSSQGVGELEIIEGYLMAQNT